jgi:hypothetical protein
MIPSSGGRANTAPMIAPQVPSFLSEFFGKEVALVSGNAMPGGSRAATYLCFSTFYY